MEEKLHQELVMHPKEKLSWDEIMFMTQYLAAKIKRDKIVPEAIYAIPRGGYVPAVMLSHLLGIPMIISSELLLEDYIDKCVLIVDDIVDTGQALTQILSLQKGRSNWISVALCVRGYSSIYPTFVANEYPQPLDSPYHAWIVFPWEMDKD